MSTTYGLLLGLTSEDTVVVTPPGTANYYLLLALTTEQGTITPPPPTPTPEPGVPGGTIWYEVVGGYVGPHRPPNLRTRRGW